jgi:hypothetical protein
MTIEQNTKADNLNHVERYFYLRDGKNRRNICIAVLRQKGFDFTQIGVAVWNPKDPYNKTFARDVALQRAKKAYIINSVQPFRRNWNSFTISSRNGIPKREQILRVILCDDWHGEDRAPGKLIRAARRAGGDEVFSYKEDQDGANRRYDALRLRKA